MGHYYSRCPYQLVKKQLEVAPWTGAAYGGMLPCQPSVSRQATRRQCHKGGTARKPSTCPKSHREPRRVGRPQRPCIGWADNGRTTAGVISHILERRVHPQLAPLLAWASSASAKAHGRRNRMEWLPPSPIEPSARSQYKSSNDPAQAGKLPLAQQEPAPCCRRTTPTCAAPAYPLTPRKPTHATSSNPGQTPDPALERQLKALHEQSKAPGIDQLSFEERLAAGRPRTDQATTKRF